VAFVGAKGGVGSSTVAHNFAHALTEHMQTNAVIVDFDLPFGTAGLDFNQDPLHGVVDALSQPDRLDSTLLERMMARCTDRLSLFAAPATLDDAEPEETDDAEDIDEIDDGKMYGTSGAEFNVVGEFIAGRVGYRHIGNGEVRVRVEPAEGKVLDLPDWKQPDSDGNRYSKVGAASTLNDLLVTAGKALADASLASALGTATLAKAA
jgi:hypothetical protein